MIYGTHQKQADRRQRPAQIAGVALTRDLHFDVGHLPGDCNMSGVLDLNDATFFGAVCPTENPLVQVDLDDSGYCNLNDATKFGQIWSGEGNEGKGPAGDIPWLGVGLPPLPCPDP